MKLIRRSGQNKKTSQCGGLLICNSNMVRQVDYRWNHFESSLRLLHCKLEEAGLINVSGEINYGGRG